MVYLIYVIKKSKFIKKIIYIKFKNRDNYFFFKIILRYFSYFIYFLFLVFI